jgi:hypothetical protein
MPASPGSLLGLLVAGDALFVALHVAHVTTPVLQDPRFSLDTDRGFAEVYQYLKEYWSALLLLRAGLALRAPVLVVWAVLFGYLMVDDAFMLHERAGEAIARRLPAAGALPLREQDVGEAVVAAAVGVLALAAVGLAHAWSAGPARAVSWRLLRLVGLLALFGVGVDLVHELLPPGSWHAAVTLVEDGGELVVMTAIVWFAARVRVHPP